MSIRSETALDLVGIREFIAERRWQFAKTMPQIPHWYTVRAWDPDEAAFERFVMYIREHGYKRKFGSRWYTYLDMDGHAYWTMGAAVNVTTVINRKVLEQEAGA